MPGVRRTKTKPALLSEAAQLLRQVAREYVDEFIQTQFKVVDPAGNVVNFKYKHGQNIVAAIFRQQEDAGEPVRDYILKSRQIGLTTMTANRNFVKTWANDNRRAITVAHLDLRAQEILGKIKFAYSKLPPQVRFELSQDSKAALEFADFNSKMFICSAATIKSIELARGDTVQDVHASELTRWADPEHGMFELQQVCHMLAGTSIVIETTGKRYGSWAHKFWQLTKAGKTPYRPIFLKWQDDPECDLDRGTWTDEMRDRFMREVWEYCPDLIERGQIFNLKPGCIYWAYLKLRDQCNGNWESFIEDYPCSDEEAWRSKGDLYFGANNIIKLLHRVQEIPYVGYKLTLENLENGFKSFGELTHVTELDFDSDEAWICVWKGPMDGRRYVVPSDSSSGTGSDFSSNYVQDMYTGEQMTEFSGMVQPHQNAIVMESLARIYNCALAAPEVNSMGMATLQELKRKYPHIFIWRSLDDNKQRLSNKLGWYTSEKSRNLMLALAKRVVEEVASDNVLTNGVIRSTRLINQMRTFVNDPITGRPEAASGCNDDCVITFAIGWFVSQLETAGAQDDILNILRPIGVQESQGGVLMAKKMDVYDAIDFVRQQLRIEEYGNYG
jgi:hypothetical protein